MRKNLTSTLVSIGLLSGVLCGSGIAFAQEPAPAAGAAAASEDVTYKAKTVYDFDDDMVEGDLQRPDGELINALKDVKHDSLIEIRKDFIPEMLKSLEDM